ncbi:hypothetical protein L209DRAFT_433078 [Thermothelomyces heterothallicus CBS 203.75]
MSPHGKRLWPEAARRERDTGTSTLVTMDCPWRCWPDGRGKAGAFEQLGLLACSFVVVSRRSSLREERKSAVSATHDQPRRFTPPPAARLAGITPSGGERGLSGNTRKRRRMILPLLAVLLRSRYLDFHLFHPACAPSSPHDPADPRGPRRGKYIARRVMEPNTMRSRPGALTRPRRLCPTLRRDAKAPARVSSTALSSAGGLKHGRPARR